MAITAPAAKTRGIFFFFFKIYFNYSFQRIVVFGLQSAAASIKDNIIKDQALKRTVLEVK